jgi:hypothetical protein
MVLALLGNTVSGVVRGLLLKHPEEAMSAAEVDDRRLEHLWKVFRWAPAWQLSSRASCRPIVSKLPGNSAAFCQPTGLRTPGN